MKVHLWSELGFYAPGRQSRFEFRLERPMPAKEVFRLLGVPVADVAVFGVNGVVERMDDPAVILTDKDRIDAFPNSSGG